MVLGMAHHDEIEGARILQQPEHHARIGDLAAAGRHPHRAGRLCQPDFGEFHTRQSTCCGRQRMHPDVRLDVRAREFDQRRIVERRRAVGHQHDAGNAARQTRPGIGLEHAGVDQRRCEHLAAAIDDARLARHVAPADPRDLATDDK